MDDAELIKEKEQCRGAAEMVVDALIDAGIVQESDSNRRYS